jgi:hypothetical protein
LFTGSGELVRTPLAAWCTGHAFYFPLVVSLSNHEHGLVLPPSLKLRRTAVAQSAEAGRQAHDERCTGPAIARHITSGFFTRSETVLQLSGNERDL